LQFVEFRILEIRESVESFFDGIQRGIDTVVELGEISFRDYRFVGCIPREGWPTHALILSAMLAYLPQPKNANKRDPRN
jgi:hypothetical protein